MLKAVSIAPAGLNRGAGQRVTISNRTGIVGVNIGQGEQTGNGTATQVQQWAQYRAMMDCAAPSVIFQNSSTVDGIPYSPSISIPAVTIRAGILRGDDAFSIESAHQLLWPGGGIDIKIQPGQMVESLPLGINFAKGESIFLATRFTYDSVPSIWPCTSVLQAAGYHEFGTSLTDRTVATGWSGGSRVINYGLTPPVAIKGLTPLPQPVVAIFGDSISSAGANDDFPSGYWDWGWAQRGLDDLFIPWINAGGSGAPINILVQSASEADANQYFFQAFAEAGVTHVLVPLGTNDISNGRTGAQIYGDMQTLGTASARYNIKTIPCTMYPKTDEGNTADATSGNRATLNGLIKTNNGVGYGYFDAAAYCQDPVNTTLWRSDLGTPTSDGTHPSGVIHTAIKGGLLAAGINLFN